MSGVAFFLREPIYRSAIVEGMGRRLPDVAMEGLVDSLEDLISLCQERSPRVVVFLSPPDISDWEVAYGEIQSTCPGLQIVAVDNRQYEENLRTRLLDRADTVISDENDLEHFLDVISEVVTGERW